jgi:SAM-dependent methyltransferase
VIDGDWEREAENWIAWARTPGHDDYWHYSPLFFELVPPPGRATLEIGCGEGRVARDLGRRGHRVVAVDAAPTLLAAASEADSSAKYLVADAAALPFADGAFHLVVAYNALMDIADMPGAVREAARVLEPGGRLCACVTHPLMDAGRWESRDSAAAFVIEGSYLGRRRFEGSCRRAGLEITFRGWCYPLEAYARACRDAGFLIEAIREPTEPESHAALDPGDTRHRRIPTFLFWRAVKPGS